MSIKPFETRLTLKQNLRSRGLKFNDRQLDNCLIKHNYFNLFNGLETVFLDSTSPKQYSNVKLQNFLDLYHFDKEIRSILSKCIDCIEENLKASIAYHFCEHYCSTLADTMQYTNKTHFMDPADNNPMSPTYCRYSSTYPFKQFQNKNIYTGFQDFVLFKPYFLTNLVDHNDHIQLSFYRDSTYTAPNNVAKYQDSQHQIHSDVAVPFWVAIETLTLGEVTRLLHYLKDSVMMDVLKDFDLPLSKRSPFLNMIDFILCLRNSCAHTTLVNRFRTQERYHINSLLIASFSLSPKNRDSVLKLFDVIKILSYFTDISALKKPFKILRLKLFSLGIIKGTATYNKILQRMGCSSYREWMKIFSAVKYSL